MTQDQLINTDEPAFLSFSFKGRVGRLHFFIINLVINITGSLVNRGIANTENIIIKIFVLLISLVFIAYYARLVVLRLHDMDWPWIPVIPILAIIIWAEFSPMATGFSFIISLILVFTPGTKGANQYGEQPGAEDVREPAA